jgi:hypothetical protein
MLLSRAPAPPDIVTYDMEQPKRQRHLMDPSAPRKRASAEDLARLARVQRWVVSVLVMTTILHLSAGLVIGSAYIDDDRPDAIIVLNVLASAFGVLAIASAFAIHKRSLLSPWLLLGVLPGIVGVFLVLR